MTLSKGTILLVLCYLACFFCTGVKVTAQHSEIAFKHLSTVDGLSNFTVLSIAQDHKGFMWFGTMDGLNRFDGKQIRTYREDLNDPNSLGNNFVHSLQCSSDSGLWVGTNRGLYYYDYNHDNFHSLPIIDSIGNENTNIVVRSLLSDGKWLWIGTNQGLFRYDLLKEAFVDFDDEITEYIRPSGTVYAIKKSINGSIWIGEDRGLTLYQGGEFNNVPIEINSKPPVSIPVLSIAIDDAGKVWFGNSDLEIGVIIYDPMTQAQTELSQKDGYIPYNRVNSLFRFDGNIWAGTTLGLAIIDQRTYTSQHLFHENQDPGSISQNSIKRMFQSKSGVIWVGTYSGGVNYFDPKSQRITHWTDKYDNENSINFNIVSSIFEDKNKNLWIGTEYGGVNIFSYSDKKFRVLKNRTNKNSLISNNIKSIIENREGRMFIATQFGLSIYNPIKGSFINISQQPSKYGSLNHHIVHDLCEDKLGNIWVGTLGSQTPFQMYETKSDSIHHFYPEDTNFPVLNNVVVNSMLYDEKRDIVWAGGNNGLAGLNAQTKKYLTQKEFLPTATTLQNVLINDLFLDNNGMLWIATFGRGLYILDVETFQLRNISREEGLFESSFYALVSDDDGNIWTSVNAHLLKIKAPKSINESVKSIEKFDIQEGFPPQQYFRTSTYKGADGTLYFGGDNGFISFNPREIKNRVIYPTVAITDILTNGKSLDITSKITDQYLNVASLNQVDLDHSQSSFSVQFIAPNYINPENTWYKYRLSEVHESWQDLGNSNAINFTKLATGNYQLKIKASSDPDNFSKDYTSLNLNIHPPFWGTPMAYAIYIVALVGLLYLFFLITRKWERLSQNLRFEHLQREKELEFHQHRTKFFTDISHELRTPLTLILAPLERIVLSNFGSARIKNQLMLMLRNGDRMLQLINQLLDLRKLETGNMQLKAAKGNIVNFIKEVSLSFRELAQSRHIEFKVESSRQTIDAWFDRDKFEIILYNLLSNAINYSPDHGRIGVIVEAIVDNKIDSFKEDAPDVEGTIKIKIQNTGQGISESQIEHIFERFYSGPKVKESMVHSSGVGLEIVKNLVDLHKGEISVESSYDENGINGQTCFTISLREGKKHLTNDQLLQEYRDSEDIANYRKPMVLSTNIREQIEYNGIKLGLDEDLREESILIVEDNSEVRKFVADIFRERYHILEADNGQEGLNIAFEKIPDLIISDIMMPGIDGIELCRKIKTDVITSHIPVILLTARTAVTFKYEGLETGADDYIIKPFSVENLELRARNLIRQRKILKERFGRSSSFLPSEITLTSVDEKMMQKTVDYLLEHIGNSDLTVEKLAREIGMSRANFYRKIKALTNMSASEFLRKVRMEHAAQLLKTNKIRISEVRYMVGISDADYFRKCFKTHFGLTPKDYIESNPNSPIKP